MKPRFRAAGLDICLVLIAAGAVAAYLHWPALTDPYRFHHNWRQAPHWLSPERQHFQPDDLLVRFAEFPIGPVANFIYITLARTGIDIFWGKVVAVVFFALTALSVYIAGRTLLNRVSGAAAVIIFLFFPCMFYEFSGGFEKALSCPLYALTIWTMHHRKWWWSIPLMIYGVGTYPMVGIHIGIIYLVDALIYDIRDGTVRQASAWKAKYLPLGLAAVIGIGMLGWRYLGANHEFGELVSRSDMQDQAEFTSRGRYHIIPTRPLWQQVVERVWGDYFHLALPVLAVACMGRRAFRLPRGLYATLLGSLLLYWLSDLALLRLYVPDRYLLRSLPIFMALTGGYWWALVFQQQNVGWRGLGWAGRIQKNALLVPVTLGLMVLGGVEFESRFEPGIRTRKFDRQGLYAAINELPGTPLIAVHPRLGSDILLLTGRSVLVSKQLALPWWPAYFEMIRERTQDLFRAYYATDPAVIRQVINKYQIDYWILQPEYYRSSFIRKRRLYQLDPFDDWIRKHAKPSPEALLQHIPAEYRLYQDRRSYVVSSEAALRWLDGLEAVPRPRKASP